MVPPDTQNLRHTSALDIVRHLRHVLAGGRAAPSTADLVFNGVVDVPKVNLEDDAVQEWYRKTAGMHTVQKWCENYHKHPYGWGALIMIHGTDEVCFRLRTKVENYAVYSALFLSASIVLLMSPSEGTVPFHSSTDTTSRWTNCVANIAMSLLFVRTKRTLHSSHNTAPTATC